MISSPGDHRLDQYRFADARGSGSVINETAAPNLSIPAAFISHPVGPFKLRLPGSFAQALARSHMVTCP